MKSVEKRKHVVIVGGGTAGIMLANRLRKNLAAREADITVIERRKQHYYQSGWLTLLFDIDKPESLTRNVSELVAKGVDVLFDEAKTVDASRKLIKTRSGSVPYDYLVIATGAKLLLDEPAGMKEGLKDGKSVFTFYTQEHALKLREALKRFTGGTVVSCIADLPIKCLAAPVGFIMMAEAQARKRGIRDKCQFILTTPSTSVPPSVEPYAGYVERLLQQRGIEVRTEFTPSKINADKAICEDYLGNRVPFDLLAIVPPHTGDDLVQNSLALGDPVGWVMCNKNSLVHREFADMFVIGDAASLPSGKTATAAERQAVVLSQRISDSIRGKEPTATYDGTTICPILTEYGKALFAEFDYSGSRGRAVENRTAWYRHVYLSRWRYWNVALKGRAKI